MHIAARLGIVLSLLPVPAVAQDARTLAVERAAVAMRPGDHRFADDPALPGAISIVVSVPMQMAFVYRGEALIGATTVSTGKPGKMTPIGEYTILQKRPFHRSNRYANAPMPFMQRLTWGGVALAITALHRRGGKLDHAADAHDRRRPADHRGRRDTDSPDTLRRRSGV